MGYAIELRQCNSFFGFMICLLNVHGRGSDDPREAVALPNCWAFNLSTVELMKQITRNSLPHRLLSKMQVALHAGSAE